MRIKNLEIEPRDFAAMAKATCLVLAAVGSLWLAIGQANSCNATPSRPTTVQDGDRVSQTFMP